jgi:outer membrane protein, heavy metal efflux system
MSRHLVTIAIALIAQTPVGHAQTTGAQPAQATSTYIDPVDGLTLQAAVSRALEREPTLRASRGEVDVMSGLRVQAGLRPNPSVSFAQQEEPSGTDRQTRVELQWPLDLFRRTGRIAVADREVDVARYATADRERTLAADVRMKYGAAAAAIRSLSIVEQLAAAAARQLTLVTSRVDQGAAPALERDMLRVEVQRLEADRLVQQGVVERNLFELKRLIAMPIDTPLKLRQRLEELVRPEEPLAAPVQQAVAVRPDVREAESRVALADAQIDSARREGRPDVSVFGMYMRMDAGFPQQGFSPAGSLERVRGVFHYVSGGLMITMPFQNRNQGAVTAAQAQRSVATAQLDSARLAAQSEIAAAHSRDEHARRALAAFSNEGLTLAARNLDVVRQTYDLGRGTLVDVLNEQRRYLDTERAYTEVMREAYEARQALVAALGEVR